MTTLALATCFLCLASWPFVRTRPVGSVVAILFGLSALGFAVCVWFAVPEAIDAF